MTPQQTGSRVMIGYVAIAAYVKAGLEEAGYEVDQRPVRPGEDLSEGGYDAVVIGLAPIRGNPARHTYGGLWARREARRLELPSFLYVDDWQYPKVRSEIVGQERRMETTFFNEHKRACRAFMDDAIANRAAIEDELTLFARAADAGEWEPVVYPSWAWGDSSIVAETVPSVDVVKFDPGAWAYEICEQEYSSLRAEPVSMGGPTMDDAIRDHAWQRDRAWIMAVLSDQSVWLKRQGFEWPVEWYGGKGTHGKLPEREIRRRILGAWGVLSPGYKHAASGWWRVRAFDAVLGGAIWAGGKTGRTGRAEMEGMPGGEDVWHVPHEELERMDEQQLANVNTLQLMSLQSALVPKAEAAAVLRKLLA
jgi:hypothetical protein